MLPDMKTLVADLVRDNLGQISDDQSKSAIELAVSRYSSDRPLSMVEEVSVPGGTRLPCPPSWTASSRAVAVEWPIGMSPPASLPFFVVRTPGAEEILTDVQMSAGSTALVHFTTHHRLSETVDTIPAEHREAVAAYASALLFEQLASVATRNADPTIHADSVNHQSQAQEFASRARAARKRYADVLAMGGEASTVKPAAAVTNWPGRQRFPGSGARGR